MIYSPGNDVGVVVGLGRRQSRRVHIVTVAMVDCDAIVSLCGTVQLMLVWTAIRRHALIVTIELSGMMTDVWRDECGAHSTVSTLAVVGHHDEPFLKRLHLIGLKRGCHKLAVEAFEQRLIAATSMQVDDVPASD